MVKSEYRESSQEYRRRMVAERLGRVSRAVDNIILHASAEANETATDPTFDSVRPEMAIGTTAAAADQVNQTFNPETASQTEVVDFWRGQISEISGDSHEFELPA